MGVCSVYVSQSIAFIVCEIAQLTNSLVCCVRFCVVGKTKVNL